MNQQKEVQYNCKKKNIKPIMLIAVILGVAFTLTGGIVYYASYYANQFPVRPPIVQTELDILHGLIGMVMTLSFIVAICGVVSFIFSSKIWIHVGFYITTFLAFIMKVAIIVLLFRNNGAVSNSIVILITLFIAILAFAIVLFFSTTRIVIQFSKSRTKGEIKNEAY